MTTDAQQLWQVREYDPARDAAMVKAWARFHGTEFREELLPPVGIVAACDGKPMIASWMHLCYGVGIAIVDRIYTATGIQRKEARAAFLKCMDALRTIAREHNNGLLMAYAPPALAAFAKRNGWRMGHRHLVQILTPTKEGTDNG